MSDTACRNGNIHIFIGRFSRVVDMYEVTADEITAEGTGGIFVDKYITYL